MMCLVYPVILYSFELFLLATVGFASMLDDGNLLVAENLTPEEFRDTFGVEHAENKFVPPHAVFIPKGTYHDSSSQSQALGAISLFLDGDWLNLPLTSSFTQLFGDRVAHIERYANHSKLLVDHPRRLINDCHYHSKDLNDVYAAISTCDGHVKGTVVRPEGVYVIHPIPDRHRIRLKRGAEESIFGEHVIYKREAFTSTNNFCQVDEKFSYNEQDDFTIEDVFVLSKDNSQNWNSAKRKNLTVELALFVDDKLWEKFEKKYGSQADSNLRDFATTVFNNIQIMYHHPSISPSVTFKIVRYEIFKSQPVRLTGPYHNNGQAQEYLDNFCKYQQRISGNNWDHSFLLTGYDLHRSGSSSISGIARLHGMCDEWNACTLAEGIDFTSVFIGTHEFGHGVGMRHDEPYCQSSYIMSSSLGPGKVSWSSCSMKDFHKFIDRLDRRQNNCMRRINADKESLTVKPDDMPGIRYTGDKQCKIMHGPGFRQVSPRQDSTDGPCNMMWCGQGGGRIITSHPALEGTYCRPGKWCVEGKCLSKSSTRSRGRKTYFQPAAPAATWTSWSATSCSQCSCSSISGAIALVTSNRKCSTQGSCHGVGVRGIMCNQICHGTDTVNDLMDKTCSAHRADKMDYELTGHGSQLTRNPNRACKIFCNIDSKESNRRRTYRLFGDIFPDGTPCGRDSYCTGGECLAVSCGKAALVDAESNCPTASETCKSSNPSNPLTSSGLWSSWSQWSSCSKTCGTGNKHRRRSCSNHNCNGSKKEEATCNERVCYKSYKGYWETWQSWTTCSASCGGGLRWRYRRCDNSHCDGENSEQDNCAQEYCPWSPWTRCSKDCGTGVQKRNRDCSNNKCFGEPREERYCNTESCSLWSEWNYWSLCSVTCGKGTRTRSRSCSGKLCPRSGIEEDRHSCSHEYCPWESWTSCSRTCGQGSRARFRKCPGGGCRDKENPTKTNQETVKCVQSKCIKLHDDGDNSVGEVDASWTSWGEWTECSVSCGEGMKARYRKCKDINGGWSYDCFGADYLSAFCAGDKCGSVIEPVWSVWSAWSSCSKTCDGYGVKSRWRGCTGGHTCSGAKDEEVSCGSYDSCPNLVPNRRYSPRSKGYWSEWSLWGSCSSTCGAGSRTRSRNCFKGECSGRSVQREQCQALQKCPEWGKWSSWSKCTRTCGGGVKQRTRACNDAYGCSGKNNDEEECSTWPCYVGSNLNSFNNADPVWSHWDTWSPCSATCNGGKQSRRRTCVGFGCHGSSYASQKCNKEACAAWGGWGLWSECSVTCGSGTNRRLRNCYGLGDCYGDKEQLEACNRGHCFRS